MLYGEIIAVCSEIHTKHINTLCGQNLEIYGIAQWSGSNHRALKDWAAWWSTKQSIKIPASSKAFWLLRSLQQLFFVPTSLLFSEYQELFL